MFDIKLYDSTGERETIRGLDWTQMTVVQSVISRLHFLLGNKEYKHKSNQVADENKFAALRAENERMREALEKLRSAAYQAVAHVGAANYPERQDEAYKMIDNVAQSALTRKDEA